MGHVLAQLWDMYWLIYVICDDYLMGYVAAHLWDTYMMVLRNHCADSYFKVPVLSTYEYIYRNFNFIILRVPLFPEHHGFSCLVGCCGRVYVSGRVCAEESHILSLAVAQAVVPFPVHHAVVVCLRCCAVGKVGLTSETKFQAII